MNEQGPWPQVQERDVSSVNMYVDCPDAHRSGLLLPPKALTRYYPTACLAFVTEDVALDFLFNASRTAFFRCCRRNPLEQCGWLVSRLSVLLQVRNSPCGLISETRRNDVVLFCRRCARSSNLQRLQKWADSAAARKKLAGRVQVGKAIKERILGCVLWLGLLCFG